MKKLITTTILAVSILLSATPVLAVELTSDEKGLVIGLEDIYLEMKEMRKEITAEIKEMRVEIKEIREEMATKDDLARVEQNLQTQITAIWQAFVGFIIALVITLLSVKYFFFTFNKKEVKEDIIKDEEFNRRIKEYIANIIKESKHIL